MIWGKHGPDSFINFFAANKGGIMKCLACGREMLNKGTHLECPNILCDYEEEAVIKETEMPDLRLLAPLLKHDSIEISCC